MEYYWLSSNWDPVPPTQSMKKLPLNVVAHFGFYFFVFLVTLEPEEVILHHQMQLEGKKNHKSITKKIPQFHGLEEGLEEIWRVRKYLLLRFCCGLFFLAVWLD